ncbi:MAG: hypothetical protein BGP05_08945 [Rhizobiales bacterium 62-47]|nr:hypothetical protein [Hyphomicrobiales bacterium]OJY14026.1 MAG: hypothetical protein BGP05_08945 [Rhizobiales bacterium 62-47]
MSTEAIPMRRDRRWIWLLVGAGLALVIGANWHLVYVAVTSQPDCVTHVRGGTSGAAGSFSAAKSSCTPR